MNRRQVLQARRRRPHERGRRAVVCSPRPRADRAFCWCSCAAATIRPICSFPIRAASTTKRGRISPSLGPTRPRTPARSRWMPTGRSHRPCATRSARCTCSARSRSSRSPAPTICRAATSKPRTASSSVSPRERAQLSLGLSRPACPTPCSAPPRQTLPIAFTDALPLAFEGAATVPNLSLKNVGKPPFDERQARILSDMYAGHHLEAAVRDGLESAPGGGTGDGATR